MFTLDAENSIYIYHLQTEYSLDCNWYTLLIKSTLFGLALDFILP